jgi:hypothetical protein
MEKHILATKEKTGFWSLWQCIGNKGTYSMLGNNLSTLSVQEEAFRLAEQWEKATGGETSITFDCTGKG